MFLLRVLYIGPGLLNNTKYFVIFVRWIRSTFFSLSRRLIHGQTTAVVIRGLPTLALFLWLLQCTNGCSGDLGDFVVSDFGTLNPGGRCCVTDGKNYGGHRSRRPIHSFTHLYIAGALKVVSWRPTTAAAAAGYRHMFFESQVGTVSESPVTGWQAKMGPSQLVVDQEDPGVGWGWGRWQSGQQ